MNRPEITERQWKEIEFCIVYSDDFNHGSTNHNIMNIVAIMARAIGEFIVDGELKIVPPKHA